MEDYFIFEEETKKTKSVKDKHKITSLVLSFVIVALAIALIACNIIFWPDSKDAVYYNSGNNFGNISSGGYAVGADAFVYFSNANDGYTIWRQNTSSGELHKINSSQSWNIVYSNGWLYYSNYDDEYSIYKIRPDGTENTKLNDTKSLYLNVSNDWIYFTDSSNGGNICKMDTNGKNFSRLNNVKSVYLCLYNEWIYFSNSSNMSYLYKVKTDGSEQTLVYKKDVRNLNIHNEYLYFTAYEDESDMLSNIYRVSMNGSSPVKLSDEYCENIIIYGDFIYYVAVDRGHIGRMNADGSSNSIIFELTDEMNEIKFINICNDKLYYCASDNNDINYSFSVNLDGTDNELLK